MLKDISEMPRPTHFLSVTCVPEVLSDHIHNLWAVYNWLSQFRSPRSGAKGKVRAPEAWWGGC